MNPLANQVADGASAIVAGSSPSPVAIESVFDMVLNGGPLMIPIALCSIVSIAFVVERSIRLREGELGSMRYGKRILSQLDEGGPELALKACEHDSKPLGRVYHGYSCLEGFGSPAPWHGFCSSACEQRASSGDCDRQS